MPSPGTPHEVLADLGDLTRKVRAAQRGTWFPLLLLGLLTLGGILVSHFTLTVETVPCPVTAPAAGTGCTLIRQGSPVYWPVGLALAYAATAFFYVRRSRKRGVGTRIRPYILTGIVLVGMASATAYWSLRQGVAQPGDQIDFWGLHLDPASGVTQFIERLAGNAMAVGLPLLVLSWVERSLALLLLTAAYLAVELVPLTSGWAGMSVDSPWPALPHFAVPGALLLLGAVGFALAELPRRSAS